MAEKEKIEFPSILKWFDLEKEVENVKILNSIQFAMFMFYRKSFKRYKLIHNDYGVNDFNGSEEEIQNEIVQLNFGIENVLYSISEDINNLITNESSIINIDFCEELVIIAEECNDKLYPGLPFGIIAGGKKLKTTLCNYIDKIEKLGKMEELDE